MTNESAREAMLAAFDRLFERAASKLNLKCTNEEREEARRSFAERYDEALTMMDTTEFPPIAEPVLERMENALDHLSPGYVAGQLATAPLAMHLHESVRQIALRAAEQRLLEHLVGQADDRYGGN